MAERKEGVRHGPILRSDSNQLLCLQLHGSHLHLASLSPRLHVRRRSIPRRRRPGEWRPHREKALAAQIHRHCRGHGCRALRVFPYVRTEPACLASLRPTPPKSDELRKSSLRWKTFALAEPGEQAKGGGQAASEQQRVLRSRLLQPVLGAIFFTTHEAVVDQIASKHAVILVHCRKHLARFRFRIGASELE